MRIWRLLILALPCLLISLIFTVPDRQPCDDDTFLMHGSRYSEVRPASNWGPLYGLWHVALQVFVSESTAYMANYRILAFLLPFLFSLAILRLSSNVILASLAGS